MIDLHCHILPGIDDGAKDLATALTMLEMARDDGITAIACTPHIYPGLYPNTYAEIAVALTYFREDALNHGFDIALGFGSDIHADVNLSARLTDKALPTLFGSRYFLLEMPNHFPVNLLQDNVFSSLSAGFVPVITHPERQGWCDRYYHQLKTAVEQGAWVQITANSLTGTFGKAAQSRAERLLDDGLVALIASDGHNTFRRPPVLTPGVEVAKKWVGESEAWHMVCTRPHGVVDNTAPDQLPLPLALSVLAIPNKANFWARCKNIFI
jgi:protein-tyrosine phosphatase